MRGKFLTYHILQDGFTPLAVALQLCHDGVVSLLLERDSGGKGRLPALHVAAKKDDVHAVSLLLSNNDVNVNHVSAVSISSVIMYSLLYL